MKEIYIRCDCTTEVMRIEYDEEEKQYYISIYEYKTSKYPIRQKLKWIWRIFRFGTPYGDQIVVSKEKMDKLKEFL